jgi:tRNA(Ile)-lysidine synthetase-like protein
MPLLKIKSFFEKYSIRDCRIAVAFSGGADSTALFHLLREISPSFNLQVFAIHVNYCLRGEDSDGDEKFVRKLCEENNLHLFAKTADISNNLSKIEEIARLVRYDFFAKKQKENNIKFVATAHNANDQAETLLFRLARKTGIWGAAGISPFREDGIIRPILNVGRKEILEYLNKNQYAWREDKTNSDIIFSRNRIRENIIPELEKINPAAIVNIAGFCDFAREISQKSENASGFLIRKEECVSVIREKCYEKGLVLNEAHCASIESCKKNTGALLLLPNFKLYVLKDLLFFLKNGVEICKTQEKTLNQDCTRISVGELWEIIISDKMPEKGENFAVVQKDDFPLKIKNLSPHLFLKSDSKTAFERMKKAGLSKFERENSPAVFSSNGDLLAVAHCSWKFDEKTKAFRWLSVRNNIFV